MNILHFKPFLRTHSCSHQIGGFATSASAIDQVLGCVLCHMVWDREYFVDVGLPLCGTAPAFNPCASLSGAQDVGPSWSTWCAATTVDAEGFRWLTWSGSSDASTATSMVQCGDSVWVRLSNSRGGHGVVHAVREQATDQQVEVIVSPTHSPTRSPRVFLVTQHDTTRYCMTLAHSRTHTRTLPDAHIRMRSRTHRHKAHADMCVFPCQMSTCTCALWKFVAAQQKKPSSFARTFDPHTHIRAPMPGFVDTVVPLTQL